MDTSQRKKLLYDIILVSSILIAAIIFAILLPILRGTESGEFAVIYVKSKEVARLSLSENLEKEIFDENGEFLLKIVVKDGKISAQNAVCRDRTCEKMGEISRTGENIICLYSQVIIRVEGSSDDFDAVALIFPKAKRGCAH